VKKRESEKWINRGFEFLSIFVAVISAFALNNWNENRKASQSENKILMEIANGLGKDIQDIKQNKRGHQFGIQACNYFRNVLSNKAVNQDSLMNYYRRVTRDFVSIQNTAGYETLKSRGLELIKNDSLRRKIISLYEFDYDILRKLEEEYSEMQFHESYFKDINRILAPNFIFNDNNQVTGLDLPLKITADEKKRLLLYLVKIQENRAHILIYYGEVESKVSDIQRNIKSEIKRE
jgi:hypothetical protein